MPTRSQKMGLIGAISYIIGNIVGSGIFITPKYILNEVHSVGMSLTIWLLSALIALLGSFCYVELGTSIRVSGGDFAYLCFMKWNSIAFMFMCISCTIIFPASLALQAQTFAEYVFRGANVTLDPNSDYWAKKLLGFSLILLLMFMNNFSLKTLVQRFSIFASLAKIAATLTIIVSGFYLLIFKCFSLIKSQFFIKDVSARTENLKEPFKESVIAPGNLVTALFSGLFSYDGWDILNFGAEEIENPKRTMSLSILIGMTSIAALYIAVNLSYFVVLSTTQFSQSSAVAIDFAREALGSAAFVMPIMIAVLLIGSLNSTLFQASRCLQVVSRKGHLPSCISGLSPVSESPRVALFVHVSLALLVSFMGDMDQLITYVSFAQWSQRSFTMAALIWVRFRNQPLHPERLQLPIIFPIIFLIVCSGMVVTSIIENLKSSLIGLGVLTTGITLYWVFVWERGLPKFETYKSIAHDLNDGTTKFAQIVFNVMPDRGLHEELDNDPAVSSGKQELLETNK
ncbi:unnamed protein product [Caenorhabditis auriculariae]|uniref:Amino acid permease/ SLC12A domain-containing protein n=1 Tax=Caenorhabditis auriculariae TaxID=2777116 RepID=A0A8S1HRE0_9PELO|nr:unnamed protein product [Caenorhabditis auriculariae]